MFGVPEKNRLGLCVGWNEGLAEREKKRGGGEEEGGFSRSLIGYSIPLLPFPSPLLSSPLK